MTKIITLLTQTFTFLALFLAYLGNEWLVGNHGLNPWIALPAATLCMLAPYILDHLFYEREEGDTSCITLRTPQ